MKIEILGTGCKKCNDLFEAAKTAVAEKGVFAEIQKVENPVEFMKYQVTRTPALVVDGKVLTTGKVLSSGEIVALLEGETASGSEAGCDCGGNC